MPTLLVFHPRQIEGPATNFATDGKRNGQPFLEFADSVDQSAIFSGILPRQYNGGGLNVHLHDTRASATSGNRQWDVSIERTTNVDTDSFAAPQTVSAAVPAATDEVDVETVTFTDGAQMDGLLAGEAFRIRITRNNSTGGNLTGGVQLKAFEIEEP